MPKYQIVLDTMEFEDEAFQAFLAGMGIETELVENHYMNGASDVYKFTGSKEALELMVREHFGGDIMDLESIEPVMPEE